MKRGIEMKEIKTENKRSRNWVLIVYPDSAPTNWRDIISEEGVAWAHSPLHDKDINEYEVDGMKKAHYHVVIKYNNLKSYRQMLQLTGKLHAPNPQKCESLVGKVRYFTHRDNPDKYQYDERDIIAYNGLDVQNLLKPSKTELHAILKEIRKYIRENDITELYQLIDYADEEGLNWSKVIDNKYHSINAYITSRRHSFRNNKNLK